MAGTDNEDENRGTPPTDRARLRRTHYRGHYDRPTIDAILAAQPLCHLGFVKDGSPVVVPTLQWREGDRVYFHGSAASSALRASRGAEVCLTVSILDGFVLARSGFHHSVNFRSVMIYGTAEEVTDPVAKERHLDTFIDGLWPGRMATLRPNEPQEIKATALLSLPLTEASAKVRAGGPIDDEPDYELPIWAGVLPVRTVVDAPIPDDRLLDGVDVPDHVAGFRLG